MGVLHRSVFVLIPDDPVQQFPVGGIASPGTWTEELDQVCLNGSPGLPPPSTQPGAQWRHPKALPFEVAIAGAHGLVGWLYINPGHPLAQL